MNRGDEVGATLNEKRVHVGRLREANEHLCDLARLNSFFDEEGYLFFRGVLDRVEDLKTAFVSELQEQGAAKPGEWEPIWTGGGIDRIDESKLYTLLASLDPFESSTSNRQFIERIFGQPVFIFKGRTIRYALPNDSVHVTPAHQDHFFIRWSRSFRTLWIPLMDIDEHVGGLALAEGSHKRDLRDHLVREDVYSSVFKDRKQRGIPDEIIFEPWLTSDYHSGDLLVFHNLMVHRALPNRSDRIRLSIDTRCQPAGDRRTWQSEKTEIEVRHLRDAAKRIAIEEGASEQLFEGIFIELMRRDMQPERCQIQSLILELSGRRS